MKALDPWALPLGGTALIEASAGTGKTHTLTTLYLRLLVERDLLPSQILVVTYTKAATAELRERLRTRIREAIGRGDAPVEERDPDPELTRLARAARARAESSGRPDPLRRALREFDEASIFTIHGFCARALKEHAFESGLSFDAELVQHAPPLERSLAHDLWQRAVHEEPPAFVEWLLEGSGRRWRVAPDALQVDLIRPLGADEEMPVRPAEAEIDGAADLDAPLSALEAAWGDWAAAWRRDRDGRIAWLLDSGDLHKGWYERTKVESEWIPTLDEWARRSAGGGAAQGETAAGAGDAAVTSLPSWWKRLVPDGVAKGTKKGRPLREDPFFEACARVEAATGAVERAFAGRALALRRRWVDEIREAARRRREERHVLFFDDLLSELRRAVRGTGGERLVALLRERHPFALIDEFQDTDPVQYEIFRTVWHRPESEADGGLVLIGDPKQAIYSFRGADVFTYLAARRDAGDAVAGLSVNHRSDPGLVHAVNALFERPARPFGLEGIDFHPASPSPTARPRLEARARSTAGLRVVLATREDLSDGASTSARALPVGPARARIWPAFARDLADLLDAGARIDGRPLMPSDVAVLCRRKRELARAREALEAIGVPCVDRGNQDVFDSREAVELVQVLAAMLHPGNPSRLRAALSTAAHDHRASALARLDDGSAELAAAIDRYAEYGRRWAESGIAAALEVWRRSEGVTARLLTLRDGERRLTNWLHLVELLQGIALDRSLSRSSLLGWLERAIADEDVRREAGEDASLLRLERDDEAVSLVTLHRSKGLQYEIVYLPCLWENDASRRPSPETLRQGRGDRSPVLYHDPQTGRRSLDLGGPEYADHVECADEEERSERLRLLYVGLTRARRQCVVHWAPVGAAARSPLASLLAGAGTGAGETEEGSEDPGMAAEVATKWGDGEWRDAFRRLAEAAGPDAVALESMPSGARDRWQAPRPEAGELHFDVPSGRILPPRVTTSFSALVRGAPRSTESEPLEIGRDVDAGVERPIDEATEGAVEGASDLAGAMATFARGAAAGSLLHDVLEQADLAASDDEETMGEQVARALARSGLDPGLRESVRHVLRSVARTPLVPRPAVPRLADLAPGALRREVEFTLAAPGDEAGGLTPEALARILERTASGSPLARYAERARRLAWSELRGYLRGFIDAVFCDGERYYVIDYKSNHLGSRQADYRPERLLAPMLEHDYVLQYLLYSVALHRHLTHALEGYEAERHFGGVYYLFLRGFAEEHAPGCGVFYDRPEADTLRAVSALLGGGGGGMGETS